MIIKQTKFSTFRLKGCSITVYSGFGITIYKNKNRKYFGQEYYIVSCWAPSLQVIVK